MAEFPYPEYRNLWPGSALSKDRSAVTDGTSLVTSEQISDGLRLTVNEDIPAGTSLLNSTTSFHPTIQPGTHKWVVTFRNPGSTPFPVSFGSRWFNATGGQVATSSTPLTYLAPGETRTFNVSRDATQDIVSTGFWLYYPSGATERPQAGDVLEILDGITLVQSETVPPFPFNGDGANPVETLKRRNLLTDPNFTSGVSGGDEWYLAVQARAASGTLSPIGQIGARELLATSQLQGGTSTWRAPRDIPVVEGKWVAISSLAAPQVGLAGIFGTFYTSAGRSGYVSDVYTEISGSPGRQALAVKVPATAKFVTPALRTYAGSAETARAVFGDFIIAVADTQAEAEAAVASYFDGDTAPSGNLSYRWAPDGTSLEVETIQPPAGRTTVWDGEPYKSASTLWVGPSAQISGVMDVGISTESRLGIVSDVYSRSREKIKLELALPDRQLVAGERVELAAAAMTASGVTWYWRQITGPPVKLNKRENTVDFTAPNVTEDTAVRIGLYASSVDGRNRSDWRYFDLTIVPALARFQSAPGAGYDSVVTKYVGYDRGPREVWNDVIPPKAFIETPRYDAELIDLGIVPDDVQFSTAPPPRASRGAVYIDPVTGDVFRNFGEGYNETDDTLAAPRKNAWWVNPATGDILEWIED